MEKKYHTLYQIVNKINGMIYIGIHSTNNLFDSYMGSGKEIRKAIKEFGKENFIKYIVGIYDTKYEMKKAEAILVNRDFIFQENTYNLALGGNGGNLTTIHSEETKLKFKLAWETRKLTPVSEETRQKMSILHTNSKRSEESKEKISKALTGRTFSDEHRKNLSIAKYNQSEETRQKISKSNKGKIQSEETRQKISKTLTGRTFSKESIEKMSIIKKEYWKNKKERELIFFIGGFWLLTF